MPDDVMGKLAGADSYDLKVVRGYWWQRRARKSDTAGSVVVRTDSAKDGGKGTAHWKCLARVSEAVLSLWSVEKAVGLRSVAREVV